MDGLNPGRSAERRYSWRTLAAMAVFAAALMGLDRTIPDPQGATVWAIAAAVVAPLLFWAYEFQRFVRHIDEMLARLQLQGAAISAGGVLLFAAIWGVGERFALLPDLNPALLLPLATFTHGVVMLIQRVRMR